MTALAIIQKHLKDFSLLEDPEEAAALTQALRTITVEEAGSVAKGLLREREDEDTAIQFLGLVNASVPGALVPFHVELMRRQIFYPGWLYLGAMAPTVEHLLSLHTELVARNNYSVLTCLAWTYTEQVTDTFHAWQQRPPSWCPPGHEGMFDPEEAGWEVTPEGGRRLLYLPRAYELIPPSGQRVGGKSPVTVLAKDTERCRWCGRSLLTLFDIDLTDPRCASVFGEGTRLRITHCDYCSAQAPIFMDVDFDGASHWSDITGDPPDDLGDQEEDVEWPEVGLVLGEARRTPFETLGRFMLAEKGMSQIGGHPEWIQTPDYPRCPTCSERMVCVGQIDLSELDEDIEGITYAFLCRTCKKATTSYQQT